MFKEAERFIIRNAGRLAATIVIVAGGVSIKEAATAVDLNAQIANIPPGEQQQKLIGERDDALDGLDATLKAGGVTLLIYGVEKFSRRSRPSQ